MPSRYYLHRLTDEEKRCSYTQEMFGDFSDIKIKICCVVIGISLFDWIIDGTLRTFLFTENLQLVFLPEQALMISAILIYVLSYLPYFAKIAGSKILKARIISNSVAGILFGIYILLLQVQLVETALKTNNEDDWIKAHSVLSSSIYITLIINFLSPVWYLKILLPACYYLGGTIAYAKIYHPLTPWVVIRNIMSFTYVIIIHSIISANTWKLFLRRLTVDTWNQVYKYILDRNPSSIAIMDGNGKVVYSNKEFERNTGNDPKKFFSKINQLKMRNSGSSMMSPKAGMASVSFNDEAKKLLNINLHNVSMKSFIDGTENNGQYIFENLQELLSHYIRCLGETKLNNGDFITFYGKMVSKENPDSPLSYEVIIRPLPEYQRIILILNNTTERDSIATLESNNEYKNQLLASVSHELRTPLNGNLGLLQAALNDPTISDTAKNNLLFPAFRSGRLLSHLMNDLLDYSHLLTDKLVLCYESKSMKETFEYCYQLLEDAFASKDLTFNITLDERLPNPFRTDHNRLTQIILNLLTNALKFTMKGSVTIEVEYMNNNYAAIQVKDTGIGIKHEDIHKLFEEVNTLAKCTSSARKETQSKGVGLGLKVTDRLAKLLGTSEKRGVQVKSEPDQGSCFSFNILNMCVTRNKSKECGPVYRSLTIPEIPLEYLGRGDHTPSHTMACYSKQNWTFYKKKTYPTSSLSSHLDSLQKLFCVLIVDDDQFNILALESQLSQFEILVDSVNNGKQAIEKVRSQPHFYKLIFMDCQMPVMDGYEATRILVEEMETKKLPQISIIGCTAFTDKDRIMECMKCGMKQVIHKPVMRANLEKILRENMELSKINKV